MKNFPFLWRSRFAKKMLRIGANLFHRLNMTRHYLTSHYLSSKNMELYEEVDKFCMFIGYPRSGHSLIGALLDSHPNMIMAHELDVLKFIQAGFNKRQIYYLLLKNSRAYAKAGRKWHGYSYEVPNQWQGRFEKLRVIGDKKGGRTTMRLRSNPGLLDLLRTTVNIPIKLIHVVRNPYDNISSASKKFKVNLRDVIKSYFSLL